MIDFDNSTLRNNIILLLKKSKGMIDFYDVDYKVDKEYEKLSHIYADQCIYNAYHNWWHVKHCLTAIDSVCTNEELKPAIKLALLYHDAVYNVRRVDNEVQSAALAVHGLTNMGVSIDRALVIHEYILATRHGSIQYPRSAGSRWVADADLAILGESVERYDKYMDAIRREYSFVDAHPYRKKRIEVLSSFLSSHSIYFTKEFQDVYEEQARKNIQREIKLLGGASQWLNSTSL